MATSRRLTDGAKSRMIVPGWSELLKRSASVKQSVVKPEVFIGCSVESLDFAYAIQQNLQHTANVTAWDQGVFGLSQYALDNLIKQLGKSDFGIFVFAPQDVTRIRNKNFRTVRDNGILELGLFIGRLGRLSVRYLTTQTVRRLEEGEGEGPEDGEEVYIESISPE
jgi:predicted nucleotide-binding protein